MSKPILKVIGQKVKDKGVRLSIFTYVFNFILLTYLYSAAFENISVGARPSGMGSAFTAVSDDGNSLYWNPAGLGDLGNKEVVTMHRDLYGLGLVSYDFIGYIQPGVAKGSMGFSWRRLGTTSDVTYMDYEENTFMVSYGFKVVPNLCMGTNLKYYLVSYDIKASGYGLDFAFLWDVNNILKLGMTFQDLNQPEIKWDTRATDRLPSNLRVGSAINLTDFFTIAADVDNFIQDKGRVYLGSELWVFNRAVGIRTGGYSRSDRWTFTAGASLSYKSLRFDYGFDKDDALGNSHIFSLVIK